MRGRRMMVRGLWMVNKCSAHVSLVPRPCIDFYFVTKSICTLRLFTNTNYAPTFLLAIQKTAHEHNSQNYAAHGHHESPHLERRAASASRIQLPLLRLLLQSPRRNQPELC